MPVGLALCLAGSALAEQEDLRVGAYLAQLRETRGRLPDVEASLRLSYDLLSEEVQARWRTLAVFPATFDRAAVAKATPVCLGIGLWQR